MGVTAPIIVLPNGIDPHQSASTEQISAFLTRWPALRDRSVCVFLSRIHRKKNIEGLLTAWQQLRLKDASRKWVLVIAGEGDPDYMREIRKLAAQATDEEWPCPARQGVRSGLMTGA
jgi:glycosyltransferase involved in cell wall biosynthesis